MIMKQRKLMEVDEVSFVKSSKLYADYTLQFYDSNNEGYWEEE